MGSYSELKLGSLYLGGSKNEINPIIMTLFRESDKQVKTITPDKLNLERGYNPDEFEEGEKITQVQYRCSAKVAKDRLELMGYTREVAEEGFNRGLKSEIEMYEEWVTEGDREYLEETLNILKEMTLEKWLANIQRIKNEGLEIYNKTDEACKEYEPLFKYMFCDNGFEWYGFPDYEFYGDYRHFIRLVLDICPETDILVYDLTDLVLGGYLDHADDLVNYADELISQDFAVSKRIIVLTEGSTDKWIIERSLNLLYPHLTDYFRFLDFKEVNFGGGANELAKIVKAFAGVGIINRVLALFDNDTAALSEINALSRIALPKNVVVLQYPDIDVAKNYPTLGPSGIVNMDVNGLAGSIELYLGQDILLDKNGTCVPVQWKGYNSALSKYQGEILRKNELQNQFNERLRICESDPAQLDNYDWSGIKAILDSMRSAFHGVDSELIFQNPFSR